MHAPHEVVCVPRISANDDQAILVAWAKKSGEAIAEGERLCDLEYSKSVVDVPAPRGGFVFHLREVGDEVAVGKPLAIIADTAERPIIKGDPTETTAAPAVKLTAKARKLIEVHGLDARQFSGFAIVKEEHVLAALGAERTSDESLAGEFKPLTPVQRRAAKTLSESASTIPHSYLTRWVDADTVDAVVARVGATHDLMLSVSDWLVARVAQCARKWPKVLTSWRNEGVFYHAGVHVGFALNQPNGDLLVPVVREADRLDLEALVGRIRGLQKKAVRHKLEPDELTGGTITVTSLVGTGAHQVFPILVPGQAVIVALADRCDLGPVHAYALTIAFDHRVLNGSEASEFLAAVGQALMEESLQA